MYRWLVVSIIVALTGQMVWGQSRPMQGQGRSGKSSGRGGSTNKGPATELPPADLDGTLKMISSKRLTIEVEQGNTIDFYVTRKTAFYDGDTKVNASALKPGMRVSVEAKMIAGTTADAIAVHIVHAKQAPAAKSPGF